MHMRAVLVALILCLSNVMVFAEEGDTWNPGQSSDEPIPDKVGVEVHMSKLERTALRTLECSMCKAILREMHIEVVKHSMTEKGWGSEIQVWETSNAICLAMLQKYKIDLKIPKLEHKTEDEEDMPMAPGADAQEVMRSLLVLKMGCQRWIEDYGGDTSGFVFKSVKNKGSTPNQTAQSFCIDHANLCGKVKVEKRKQDKLRERERAQSKKALNKKEATQEQKRKADDPFEQLPEDSKLGIQRLLEMAKDDPLHYLEEDAKARVHKGRQQLRCDVCHAAIKWAHGEVLKRPKSMRREYDVLPLLDDICQGGKDLSVPAYFGVEPPPLPPVWTDARRPVIDKKAQGYRLKPITKKAATKRKEWRRLSSTGKQQPPTPDENEGDLMMTFSCKDVMEPARMAEVLFEEMHRCAGAHKCDAALATAARLCLDAQDALCKYPSISGKSEL